MRLREKQERMMVVVGGGGGVQVGVQDLKDAEEEEERRRHPCVLHLIRPPIEGYKLHPPEKKRERK